MTQGMRVILKNQVLITTEELYEKIKTAKEAILNRKHSSGRRRKSSALKTVQTSTDNTEDIQEENSVVVLDQIEVLVR